MTIRLTRPQVLRWITPALLSMAVPAAHAVGLGQLHVQSWLGQPLRASVLVLGDDGTIGNSCIKARMETADGAFIGKPQINLVREQQAASIILYSQQSINEPIMAISVSIDCGLQVHRTFQILLDPPLLNPVPAELPPRYASGTADQLPANAARIAPVSNLADPAGTRRPEPRLPTAARANPEPPPVQDGKTTRPPTASNAKPARSVLKLSSDEPILSYDLKLSGVLSESQSQANPQQAEDMRIAQLRFAAALRDDDPSQDAKAQARSAQERAQILQAEVQVLQEQRQINQAKLDELRKTNYSPAWIAGLAALLLASLGAIAWLAWRLRVTYKISQRKWWESLTTQGGHAVDGNTDSLLLQTTIQPTDFMPTASKPPFTGSDGLPGVYRDNARGETTIQMPGRRSLTRNSRFPLQSLGLDTVGGVPETRLELADMIKVEEISDVLQEVEFWMLLNDFARVVDILEPLSNNDKPDSPVPWLYLLDAYGELGEQVKYDALRERFERLFNVRIARWEDMSTDDESRGLEDMPHLIEQICFRWGGALAVQFLERLLIDDRDGTRAGFDLPVYRDLMMLIGIANELEQSTPPRQSSFVTA